LGYILSEPLKMALCSEQDIKCEGMLQKKGWDEMAKALFYFVSERNKTSATDILQGRKDPS